MYQYQQKKIEENIAIKKWKTNSSVIGLLWSWLRVETARFDHKETIFYLLIATNLKNCKKKCPERLAQSN